MSDDVLLARLGQLENAIRKAAETQARLRDENARLALDATRLADENAELKREVTRLGDERHQVLGQIDMLLKDIGKLDLE